MGINNIELNESVLNSMAIGVSRNSILQCLALSWQDAKEYRSVKQNSNQRMAMIEAAIHSYLNQINEDELNQILVRLN